MKWGRSIILQPLSTCYSTFPTCSLTTIDVFLNRYRCIPQPLSTCFVFAVLLVLFLCIVGSFSLCVCVRSWSRQGRHGHRWKPCPTPPRVSTPATTSLFVVLVTGPLSREREVAGTVELSACRADAAAACAHHNPPAQPLRVVSALFSPSCCLEIACGRANAGEKDSS